MKKLAILLALALTACEKEDIKKPEAETYYFRVKETRDDGSVQHTPVYRLTITK